MIATLKQGSLNKKCSSIPTNLPGALEQSVGAFVEYYNHQRYHDSLSNLTPPDVYVGRGQAILKDRRKIKEKNEPK